MNTIIPAHIWEEIGDVLKFPAKYYKCTICGIKSTALWTLGTPYQIKMIDFYLKKLTCEEYIIKNIVE